MKVLATLHPAHALLLGLVVLLVFGSCGGGVNGFLNGMGERRRTRLRSILVQERVDITTARRQLHGQARREAVRHTKARSTQRLDSLLTRDFEQQKLHRRYSKIKRQILRRPPANSPATPASRP